MKNPDVYVSTCALNQGLFANRDFEEGERILRFTGQLITQKEAIAKGDTSMNPLQIAPRAYLDLDPPGVFLNHSCIPNAGIKEDIFLIALKTIKRDEQILFDYSTSMLERHETMECLCGSPDCRKVIGDFDTLPLALQQAYLQRGIVQSFIGEVLAGV